MSGKTMTALLLAAGLSVAGCQTGSGVSGGLTPDKKTQARTEVNTMASDTLARLYALIPSTRKTVETSAGYAVFSNYGMQILVVGGGAGKGVAVNNRTKDQTFMRMVEGQAGLGVSVRKLQLVWVFDTEARFNDFVNNGLTGAAEGSASVAVKNHGASLEGAVPISPGVWLYQLTETGLAFELAVKGSKYYKDDPLN
jgi:lipid-binding SYLF domain-containing protein